MKKSTIICMILTLIFCLGFGVTTAYAETTDDGNFEYTETADGITITKYIGSDEYEVSVPAEINGKPVKAIGDEAFKACIYLLRIELPEGLESIGKYAFMGDGSFSQIYLPDSIRSIGEGAFKGCQYLKTVNIPSSITEIPAEAFSGCMNLGQVDLPEGLKEIGQGAFVGCQSLVRIELPEGLECIGDNAFSECDYLKSINLPDSIESIGEGAFYRCFFSEIKLPANIKEIKDRTFQFCGALKTIELPEGITSIGDDAFGACFGLTAFDMLLSLKTIGDNAFKDCNQLKELYISPQLQTVGEDAFKGCDSLSDIYIRNAKNYFDNVVFGEGASDPVKMVSGAGIHTPVKLDDVAFGSTNFIYDGTEHTIMPVSKTLEPGDFAYDELKVTNAGTYSLKVVAANPKTCYGDKILKIKVAGQPLDEEDVSISGMKDRTYTGAAQKQNLTVMLGDTELIGGTDYKVYYDNNTKVGTALVDISFKGNYAGIIENLTFTIKPAASSVSKLTPGTKKLTVKMSTKTSAKGATTYQIGYKQKGTSTWKYTTTTSQYKTIKSLKKGKRYYVKVRAYKTVSSKKYYGAWSKTRLSSAVK